MSARKIEVSREIKAKREINVKREIQASMKIDDSFGLPSTPILLERVQQVYTQGRRPRAVSCQFSR